MQEFADYLAPLQGATDERADPGGLRFAPTSGYFLSTLRVVIPGGGQALTTFEAKPTGPDRTEPAKPIRSIRPMR